ncbi:MAG: glycosyltransferase family 39 protein [Candidatus Omnitrophica bacterium]|nr:glycosyltransferase family 39 protein [Candidatus Omnitrophota bacterium]
MKHKITDKVALIFLLTIAAALRVISCSKYVLIEEYYTVFFSIDNFIKNYTLMPTYFGYPTLFSYLSTIPTGIVALVLYIKGVIPTLSSIAVLNYFDSVLPCLGARITSATFGLATILLLFKIGNKFFTIKTGLIAAVFLVFSRIHIHYSGYGLPEATMVFFATCSLFFSLSALKSKSIRNFILAGAFAGFTASTKYNGAFMVLPILTTHLIHLYDEKRLVLPHAWWVNRCIIFSGLAFICAFFIGSPGWILEPKLFLIGFLDELAEVAKGGFGGFGVPYVRHLVLFWNWEKTIAVFFGLGLLYAIFRHSRQDIVLLVLVLLSFFYIGSLQKKYLHYLIFLYPALCLLSARLLSEILIKLNKRVVKLSAFLILISVFGWPIYSTAIYTYQGVLQDNRWIAQKWIHNNIPERSKVVIDWNYIPKLLTKEQKEKMTKGKYRVFFENYPKDIYTYKLIPLKYNPAWLKEVRADYLITSSYCFDRFFKTPLPPPNSPFFDKTNNRKDTYEALFYKGKESGWELLREFCIGGGPRILIYRRTKKEG